MFDKISNTPEIKAKTLVWIITTLYLTVGLTGVITIALTSFLLGLVGISNLISIYGKIIFFLVFIGGYTLAFKIGINFVLKRTFIKEKYFKIIIFFVLGLTGIVHLWRGGLSISSFLTTIFLILILYIFGNYWLPRKAQEQLTKLQIYEEQLPDLKITTTKEIVGIFIVAIVLVSSIMIKNYLPPVTELQRKSEKLNVEVSDNQRRMDLMTLQSLLDQYRLYYNKFPSSLDELSNTKEIIFIYQAPLPVRDPLSGSQYGYWVSSDQQKFILRAIFEGRIIDPYQQKDYLNEDIDGWPLGEGVVDCGSQGPNEKEYCVGGGF